MLLSPNYFKIIYQWLLINSAKSILISQKHLIIYTLGLGWSQRVIFAVIALSFLFYICCRTGIPNPRPTMGLWNWATEVAGEHVQVHASPLVWVAGKHTSAPFAQVVGAPACHLCKWSCACVLALLSCGTISFFPQPICKAEKVEELCCKDLLCYVKLFLEFGSCFGQFGAMQLLSG